MNVPTAMLAVATLCAVAVSPATAEDHRELVNRYYSQFQQPGYDVDALMAFYDDEVLFTDPTFGITANGKDEVRALYADIGTDRTQYRDIVWVLNTVISDDDHVVISGLWSGSFWECPFSVEFITLWTISDGLIVRQKDFFAADAFDQQVAWDPAVGRAICDGETDADG